MSLEISIKAEGMDKVVKGLEKLGKDVQTGLETFFKREGADMEKEIKQSMSTGGRVAGTKTRLRSQPGQPPFIQTGNLRASIGYLLEKTWSGTDLLIGALRGGKSGEEVKYAAMLELGTSKMDKRPYLYPIVKRHIDNFADGLKAIFK